MAQISEVLFIVLAVMLLFGVATLPRGTKKTETRVEAKIPQDGTHSAVPENSIALEQAASGKSDAGAYSVDQKSAGPSFRKAKVT